MQSIFSNALSETVVKHVNLVGHKAPDAVVAGAFPGEFRARDPLVLDNPANNVPKVASLSHRAKSAFSALGVPGHSRGTKLLGHIARPEACDILPGGMQIGLLPIHHLVAVTKGFWVTNRMSMSVSL